MASNGPDTTADQAAAAAPPDQEAMSVKDLARAILARQVRPRVGSVRRLAEAVLAKGQKKAAKKADKKAKKARKLAKIPAQKAAAKDGAANLPQP